MAQLTKFTWAVFIFVAMSFGFVALIGEFQTAYPDTINQTSYVAEFTQTARQAQENFSAYTADYSETIQDIQEVDSVIDAIGFVSSQIGSAILLPFRLFGIAINIFTDMSGILQGVPDIVWDLISVALSVVLMYGVIKLILKRESNI